MTRGFTLVETMVLAGIYIIALIGLANLFFIFNSLYGYQQTFIATAGSAGTAMNAFEAAVLPADNVLASHAFSGVTYSSSTSTLVLQLPSVDGDGAIIDGTNDYIVFYVSDSSLYRIIDAGAGSVRTSGSKTLSSSLETLAFTYDDADFALVTEVTADIQTEAVFKEQTVQSRLRQLFRLRNL